MKHQGDQRRHDRLDRSQEHEDAHEFADIERGAVRRGQHQGAKRIVLPLSLEGAAQRERAGERDRNPENPSGRIVDCYAFTNEPEREYQDTGNREEQGRIDDLATAKLDQ